MNCPYCDATIHSLAKFCPKCGLPVKEDATLMGASVGEDGPNKAVVIAGAAAVVAVAVCIGWMSSGRGNSRETVRRERVGAGSYSYSVPAPPPTPGYIPSPVVSYGSYGYSAPAPRVITWPKPPATRPAPVQPVRQSAPPVQADVPPPQHVLTMNPLRPHAPTHVTAPRPQRPLVPSLPLVAVPLPDQSARHLWQPENESQYAANGSVPVTPTYLPNSGNRPITQNGVPGHEAYPPDYPFRSAPATPGAPGFAPSFGSGSNTAAAPGQPVGVPYILVYPGGSGGSLGSTGR